MTTRFLLIAAIWLSAAIVLFGQSLPSGTRRGTLAEPINNVGASDVAAGTTAPARLTIIGGKTADATPQFRPIPLLPGATAVQTSDLASGPVGDPVPNAAIAVAGISSGTLSLFSNCDQTVQLQMTTAATTQLVPLAANKKIHVCNVTLQGSLVNTATAIRFVNGTGSNCGAGTTSITPAFALAPSGGLLGGTPPTLPFELGTTKGDYFTVPTGNALCANNSAAGTVNIFVSYTVY